MWPHSEDMLVGETAALQIFDVSRLFDNNRPAKPVLTMAYSIEKLPILWYVNGVENGNPIHRQQSKNTKVTIRVPQTVIVKGAHGTPHLRTYPSKSPAYIRADVYVFSGKT